MAAIVVTLGLRLWPGDSNAATVSTTYLLVVLLVAATSRLRVALATSIAAMLCLDFFFLPPLGTFTIAERRNWIALFAVLGVSLVASSLSARLKPGRLPSNGAQMTRVRVESFTISLDGYGAGPHQDIDNPLGTGGTDLHQWLFPTRTLQRMLFGKDGGTTGVDDDFAARGFRNVGAWILGRNMFGPIRGPWPNEDWKGWWGDSPPYHVPVFVLTHHARSPIEMDGGTTFHFVTGGIHEALDRARGAAAGMDVRIGGGADTIRQYLREALIDELHVAIAPVLLGRGEPLLEGVDLRTPGYACVEFVASEKATHVVLRRQPPAGA